MKRNMKNVENEIQTFLTWNMVGNTEKGGK
jgi:hypothetical protein